MRRLVHECAERASELLAMALHRRGQAAAYLQCCRARGPTDAGPGCAPMRCPSIGSPTLDSQAGLNKAVYICARAGWCRSSFRCCGVDHCTDFGFFDE
jgi:hypothetical protein